MAAIRRALRNQCSPPRAAVGAAARFGSIADGRVSNCVCRREFRDGQGITNDFDGCWGVADVDPNVLDPVLLDFSRSRAAQKSEYGGELFPAELPEGASGRVFLDFFQHDADGRPKGIVDIKLETLE
jgi:hypothetical protein